MNGCLPMLWKGVECVKPWGFAGGPVANGQPIKAQVQLQQDRPRNKASKPPGDWQPCRCRV